jgi:hypothetical protein
VLRFALVVTSRAAGADSVGLLLLVRAAVEHLEHLGRAGRREDECREYECREYECREYVCTEDEWSACGTERGSDEARLIVSPSD